MKNLLTIILTLAFSLSALATGSSDKKMEDAKNDADQAEHDEKMDADAKKMKNKDAVSK